MSDTATLVIDLDGEDMDGDSILDLPHPQIWNALIPPDSLSVTSLLAHFPPRPTSTPSTMSFHHDPPTHFTSPDESGFDFTLAMIQGSPLPNCSSIQRIRNGLANAHASGYQSISLSLGSLHGLFPFWIEKCLTQLGTAESSAGLWRASLRWLESGEPDLAESSARSQCAAWLNILGWNAPLWQFRSAWIRGTDLAPFLGNNWLTDEHMNAGGDWINTQLGEKSHTRVLNTYFLGSLALNRSRYPTWNPNRPRKPDSLVGSGHVTFLIIPVHLHYHWTYLYLDLINRSCVYFDLLDPNNVFTPDGVLELLDWWLASVLPLPFEEGLSEEEVSESRSMSRLFRRGASRSRAESRGVLELLVLQGR